MKAVPNYLSASRLVLAAALLLAMLGNHVAIAATLLVAGLATDWLDGWYAREYHAESKFGADVLEPLCDSVLAAAAVGMLIYDGYWPVWVAVVLMVFALALQTISWFADRTYWLKQLKRHQHYIHPFFAVAVMTVTLGWYLALATLSVTPWPILGLYAVFVVLGVYFKRDRVKKLVRAGLAIK